MARKRSTKIGKVELPMDIRSEKDIGEFENMLAIGPLTIVLVYADWCGHCTRFKENTWNKVAATPNKNINTASVHYDMLDKTSLANSKIEGYPSLLMVGTDKKPANFKEANGTVTNAMPQPTTPEELKTMLETPIPTPVKNANSVVKTVLNNVKTPVATIPNTVETNVAETITEIPVSPTTNVLNINTAAAAAAVKTNNKGSFTPTAADQLVMPPDPLTDLVESQQPEAVQKGGSLMESLLRITGEAAHVGLLLGAASEFAHRRNKNRSKTQSRRKSSRKTLKKRR